MDRAQRLALAEAIARRCQEVWGERLLALGLYGSLARGEDGPYSDIEMYAVLRGEGEAFSYEWSAGPWKAEVDVYTPDVLLARAARVDERWPLVAGVYCQVRPLYDPEGFFRRLRQTAAAIPPERFRQAVEETLVGELYELIGKARNARVRGEESYLPELAVKTAHQGAMVLGLHHRRWYTAGSRVLPEALALPDRPPGFDPLARMVMAGRLSSPDAVTAALEGFWAGVTEWARRHGYRIDSPQAIPF
ncbi:MAG: kanamycin nucleotidyltransferase C-terminal domain-containing protein [Bacillota bacterium]